METGSSAEECSCMCVYVCVLKWKLQGWRWGGGEEEGALLCNGGDCLGNEEGNERGDGQDCGKEGKKRKEKRNGKEKAEKIEGCGGK